MSENMKSIIEFTKAIEEIDLLIETAITEEERKELEEKKQELFLEQEETELKIKIEKDGLTEEYIKQFAALEARKILLKKSDKEKEDVEQKENKYDLSSKYIVSTKTGETINISYMNLTEKIRTIYDHTGEIISCHDSTILSHREKTCANAIEYLAATYSTRKLKKMYGNNWIEEAKKVYYQGYDEYMQYYIDKQIKDIDNKNKGKDDNSDVKEDLSAEYERIAKEKEEIEKKTQELLGKQEELKKEVAELMAENEKLKISRKEDLEEYKSTISELISSKSKSNFKFTKEEQEKILSALGMNLVKDSNASELDHLKGNLIGNDFDNLDSIMRKMMICDALGIDAHTEICGMEFSSKEIASNPDYPYIELYGVTKEEHDNKVTMVDASNIIFPERQEAWNNFVISCNSDTKTKGGMTAYYALEIITALENGASIEDATKLFASQKHPNVVGGAIMNAVLEYSSRGPEFFEKVYAGQIAEEQQAYLNFKKNENIELANINAEKTEGRTL